MPFEADALAKYQRDVLAMMRTFLGEVTQLEADARRVLERYASELEELAQAGPDLAIAAYDDMGDLINEDAEEIVTAIENGVVPDLEDARTGTIDTLEELGKKLREAIESLAEIQVPKNALKKPRAVRR